MKFLCLQVGCDVTPRKSTTGPENDWMENSRHEAAAKRKRQSEGLAEPTSAPTPGGGPRAPKRRKDGPSTSSGSVSITIPGLKARGKSPSPIREGASGAAAQLIRDAGFRIWNAVRETRAAE